MQKERKIAEAQALSVRLFTATISAAIILLFLSYLTIHRELKHSANEKKKREKLIGELQKSNDANLRRNLIQNVTHELRTPLTVIGGNAELLLNDTEADNRMRHAQTIGDRMAGMINNLLVYFRLDSGKETPSVKPFKLRSITETLETEFATLAKNKGLNFKTESETDEIVSGDRNRIISIGGNKHWQQPVIQRHQVHPKRYSHIKHRLQERHIYLDGGRHRHGHDRRTAGADIHPV